jgi:hypothetical protein
VWDRSLHLSNDGAAGGGMFSPIQVGAGGAVTADNDLYAATEDTQLIVGAPGVLDGDTAGTTASLVDGTSSGALTLNADGSFTYDPNGNFNGSDSFTYRAFAGATGSNVATVRSFRRSTTQRLQQRRVLRRPECSPDGRRGQPATIATWTRRR